MSSAVQAVVVPQLDVNDVEMELVAWTVDHGARVGEDTPLCTLETAKATHDLAAGSAGVVWRAAEERSTVSVGAVIAWIGASLAEIEAHLAAERVAGPAEGGGELAVSPRAEALCREHGVDPREVPRRGALLKEKDVQRWLAERGDAAPARPAPAPAQPGEAAGAPEPLPELVRELVVDEGPLPKHRAVIARHLAATQREIVFATAETDVEVGPAEERLARAGGGANLFHLFLGGLARLLARHPRFATFRHGGRLLRHRGAHVAFTLVGADGERLLTPVVRDADRLSTEAIAEACAALTLKSYRGEIQPAELQGGSITLSMLTGLEVTRFTALQNRYQSAVLAVGAPRDVLLPAPGTAAGFRAARVVTATLSYDHGVCDGYAAGELLTDLKEVVEGEPE